VVVFPVTLRRIVVVTSLGTSRIADVSVERPGPAFIFKQRLDDFVDRVERSELVRELAVDFPVDDADMNRFPIELQFNVIPRLTDFHIDAAAAVAAGRQNFGGLGIMAFHGLPLLSRFTKGPHEAVNFLNGSHPDPARLLEFSRV
jgi:hypothetical protein